MKKQRSVSTDFLLLVSVAASVLAWGAVVAAQKSEPASAPYASAAPMPEPVLFAPGVVSTGDFESHPAFTPDGRTLYFGSDREGGKGQTDLYRCRLVQGKYAEAENLGDAINTRFNEFEPYIAPDESYMIFMGGRPGGMGGFDLYLSYGREGKWTEPKNLGDKINTPANEYSPKISPDGKYFFYTSGGLRGAWDEPQKRRLNYRELMSKLHSPQNGLGDIYQVDLSALKIER